jgi:spore germination protein GerM
VRAPHLRRGALLSLVAMGAVALGACGVPLGGSPTVIANSQVNPSALAPPPTTVQQGTQTFIYLIAASGTPAAVPLLVPPEQCSNFESLLSRLVQGPDSEQETGGFSTAIPVGTEVLSVTPRTATSKLGTGPITVDFNDSFGEVAGAGQVLAIEQIVHTIDVLVPFGQVQVLFEIDGQPIEVPVGSGAQVPRPVTSSDYSAGIGQVTANC